jgi:uncharacterized membrane protein
MRKFLQKFTNLGLRYFLSIGVSIGIFCGITITKGFYSYQESDFLWAWNGGVFTFLFLTGWQMIRITNKRMRHHIHPETIRGWTVLTILVIASCGSLLAIVSLLHNSQPESCQKDIPLILFGLNLGLSQKAVDFILSGFTLVLSWLMLHTVFTLEYAYEYYEPQYRADYLGYEKLEFPHEKNPNYWDFLYFSVDIGMASQVADVQINEGSMRRLVLFHSMISFFFNTAILATSINIIASAISTACPPNK